MQCTIYAPGEKKRRVPRQQVMVLAAVGEALILCRDEINALWMLPEGAIQSGESAEETARRVLGRAMGEAVFDVTPLCEYSVTGEDGKESGGYAFTAAVSDWADERESHARAFARMPLASQTAKAALVFALHRWAGERFDERLQIERLGQPAAL